MLDVQVYSTRPAPILNSRTDVGGNENSDAHRPRSGSRGAAGSVDAGRTRRQHCGCVRAGIDGIRAERGRRRPRVYASVRVGHSPGRTLVRAARASSPELHTAPAPTHTAATSRSADHGLG